MTTFNELMQEVFVITKRPELADATALAIKSATLQLHKSDNYFKDILEVGLQFDTSDYFQTIEYRALFPRYRSLRYLRKFYPTATGNEKTGKFYAIKSPLETVGLYGENLTDLCYIAGDVIQVRSSTLETHALIGIYQSPVVATPELYKSWIADEAPYAVIWKAASIIQATQLKDRNGAAASNEQALAEFFETKNSNIVAEGQ